MKKNQLSKFAAMSLSVFNLSNCECMDIPPTVSISNTSSVRLEVLQQTNIDMTNIAYANQDVLQQILAELKRKNDIEEEKMRIEKEKTKSMEAELEKQKILQIQQIVQQQKLAEQQKAAEDAKLLERNKIIKLLGKQRQSLADYQSGKGDLYTANCPCHSLGFKHSYSPLGPKCQCKYQYPVFQSHLIDRTGYSFAGTIQEAIAKLTGAIADTGNRLSFL